jgi:hypothetical protein
MAMTKLGHDLRTWPFPSGDVRPSRRELELYDVRYSQFLKELGTFCLQYPYPARVQIIRLKRVCSVRRLVLHGRQCIGV